MPSDWYVVLDGKASGPFDDSRIKSLTQEGQITPETLVSRAGMKQWVAARQIKGLFPEGKPAVTPRPVARPQTPVLAPRRPATATPDLDALNFATPSTSARRTVARHAAKRDFSVNIMLGCGGAAALLLGFFCPILRLPVIGSMSYLSFMGLLVRESAMNEMTVSAILVIAAIALAVLVAISKQPPLFWIPGIAGVLAALLTLGKYFWMQGEMARSMKKDLEDNPFAGLAQAMVQSVSLDFGIGVIVIGAALMIAAAVVPTAKRA